MNNAYKTLQGNDYILQRLRYCSPQSALFRVIVSKGCLSTGQAYIRQTISLFNAPSAIFLPHLDCQFAFRLKNCVYVRVHVYTTCFYCFHVVFFTILSCWRDCGLATKCIYILSQIRVSSSVFQLFCHCLIKCSQNLSSLYLLIAIIFQANFSPLQKEKLWFILLFNNSFFLEITTLPLMKIEAVAAQLLRIKVVVFPGSVRFLPITTLVAVLKVKH